jgi:lipopolysaccharide export system ATP-binding protein
MTTGQVIPHKEDDMNAPRVLRCQKIYKRFGGRRVVDDVSLSIQKGETVALLGPNGAGKTTTFYMLSGMIKPDGGEVFLDDNTITHWPMYKRARVGMAYLPQESSVFRGLTVEDN